MTQQQQLPQPQTEGRQLRSSQRKQPKAPDWASFYKNGPPKEVIVIEDTPEPPASQSNTVNGNSNHAALEPQPGSASKKRKYDDTVSQASYKSRQPANGSSQTDRETAVASIKDDPTAQAGQKRKRVTAPSTNGSEKRRDVTIKANDIEYRGLGKKATKASPVTVRAIPNVSLFSCPIEGMSIS